MFPLLILASGSLVMAGEDRVQWHPPLKVPAVEIADADVEVRDDPVLNPTSDASHVKAHDPKRDASTAGTDDEDGGESDDWSIFGDYIDNQDEEGEGKDDSRTYSVLCTLAHGSNVLQRLRAVRWRKHRRSGNDSKLSGKTSFFRRPSKLV